VIGTPYVGFIVAQIGVVGKTLLYYLDESFPLQKKPIDPPISTCTNLITESTSYQFNTVCAHDWKRTLPCSV